MLNPIQLEEAYREYTANLSNWAHDGVITIDLPMLHELGLLEHLPDEPDESEDLTQYFHVIESIEKVTLFNEQFVIWIIPKTEEETPMTYVLIALCSQPKPALEVVFTTAGVYNTPRYVLKVLQYFLVDMIETEATLTSIEKNQ